MPARLVLHVVTITCVTFVGQTLHEFFTKISFCTSFYKSCTDVRHVAEFDEQKLDLLEEVRNLRLQRLTRTAYHA